MKKALVCIDLINEIVSETGKLSSKGYYQFVKSHETLSHVAEAQRLFRAGGDLVIHVRLGFSANYAEHSHLSPLLGKAREFKALQIGTWATEFPEKIAPLSDDVVVTKNRISAFYNTSLDTILRAQGVREIHIAGVATDLAVQSAARDSHDRDYATTVLSDCCAAATDEDHDSSLNLMQKFCAVTRL
jgi:nicotinamidase-related amidase